MRDAPADIDAMIASGQFTLATCVKLQLRDGTEMGFTDLDMPIRVALASDSESNAVLYSAAEGMVLSDIDMAIGLDSDNTELSVPIGSNVTREDVIGRRFNQARVYIFDVNHQAAGGAYTAVPVLKGYIADAEVREGVAAFEVRSLADRYNATVGNILTPRCKADYGDALCGKEKIPVGATVTGAVSNMKFTTDISGYADQYFRFGEVDFLTGRLANIWPYEIVDFDAATGSIEVFSPMPNVPEVGDTLHVYQGCSKLKKSADATVPTCFTHANVGRFRGYDRVPGSDTYVKIAFPGSADIV